MKVLAIILAAVLYIVGAIVWYGLNRGDYEYMSPWALALTTIFWPVILIVGTFILIVVYLLGIIVTLIYELIRNIFNK